MGKKNKVAPKRTRNPGKTDKPAKKEGSFKEKLARDGAKEYLESLKVEGVGDSDNATAFQGILENLKFERTQHATNIARYRVMRKLNDPEQQLIRQRDMVAASMKRVEAFRDEFFALRDYLVAQQGNNIPIPEEAKEEPEGIETKVETPAT